MREAQVDNRVVPYEMSRLVLETVVPDPTRGAAVEVRPWIDGRDVLAEAFAAGPGSDPGELLGSDGSLLADVEPHEVRLAAAECTEACCGALYVTVRREGGHVVWSGWRNPDEQEVGLPEFRFDAEDYRTEVERAAREQRRERRAHPVARLLERHLGWHVDWAPRRGHDR
ncbi:hypothetical protein [Micromonospora inyonensis]|uniref:hypothetical protein n=1 Tax=Micromonospora inyonensis TaxID=47866 RepID=UPI000B898547|nr:hypothetical protein [Micromonospora inyonensis]